MFLAFESGQPVDRLCWRNAPQSSHRSRGYLSRAHRLYAMLAKLAGRPALMGHAEAYWVVVIERFSAYGLLGFLLSFLLPGRVKLACAFVVAVAVGLEVLQAVTPDRDPRFIDVLQKAAGGTVGVLLAQTILAFLPGRRPEAAAGAARTYATPRRKLG